MDNIVLFQTADGLWHVGKLLSGHASDVIIQQPHTLHAQPTPDGRGFATALAPYGFPVIRPAADAVRTFEPHALLQKPEPAPQPLAEAWVKQTTGLQIAPASAILKA